MRNDDDEPAKSISVASSPARLLAESNFTLDCVGRPRAAGAK
jgi:hypothetical protein